MYVSHTSILEYTLNMSNEPKSKKKKNNKREDKEIKGVKENNLHNLAHCMTACCALIRLTHRGDRSMM